MFKKSDGRKMNQQEGDARKLELFIKASAACEKIYELLPDGIHEHADGNLYLHTTWCDVRIPGNKGTKSIDLFHRFDK